MRLIDADALLAQIPTIEDEYKYVRKLIDNAPTVAPPQWVLRARDDAELEQLKEAWGKGEIYFTPIVAYTAQEEIIKCQDCKHQRKYWHEDKRMKEKGYWIYGCDYIDDPFVGTPVSGVPDQFCSSAERKED